MKVIAIFLLTLFIATIAADQPSTIVEATDKQPLQELTTLKPLAKIEPKQAIREKVFEPQTLEAAIIHWANHYGVSSDWLLRIANCESTMNPSAVNTGYYAGGGHPTGLFQYLPETWTRISGRAGLTGLDIWNGHHQAQVTAWAFANGYDGEWECR